jgi:DNA-binding SARP family transcriptional activator
MLDALWPELDPMVAMNSLNQTIYFLRRIFEPNYKDDLSAEYVHHDSDMVWLDSELVWARSAACWSVLRDISLPPTSTQTEELARLYRGRFALDFAYEEWAAPFRDALHASYLQVIETAVTADIAAGHFDRAIWVARRALEVDPEAEQLELCLVRLYRLTGSHAAAAEQYEHYAAVLRSELGVDPPPLDVL